MLSDPKIPTTYSTFVSTSPFSSTSSAASAVVPFTNKKANTSTAERAAHLIARDPPLGCFSFEVRHLGLHFVWVKKDKAPNKEGVRDWTHSTHNINKTHAHTNHTVDIENA